MRFLDRFRRTAGPGCDDPVFGRLAHDGTAWQGRPFFAPASGTVPIAIVGAAVPPGDRERARFGELEARYASLLPAIAQALFDLYAPAREADVDTLPDPSSATDLMRFIRLDWIELSAHDACRLGYGFVEGVGWDDAMFTVKIVGETVTGESLED